MSFEPTFAALLALLQPPPVTVVEGVTIHREPGAAPIGDGVVVMRGSRFVAVGPRATTPIPPGARVVACRGCGAFAGFWNSHVHFVPIDPPSGGLPVRSVATQLDSMLLRFGFVHVLDTGSDLPSTVALRNRIETGAIAGPEIRTAGFPFAPSNGTPFYLAPLKLPELGSPEVAADSVAARVAGGADAIKVFAASPVVLGQPPVVMDRAILRAVVVAAHARGRLVAAHPTTTDGALGAIEAGADILLHTTPDGGKPWDRDLVARAVEANVALVPTLALWRWELERARVPPEVVSRFSGLAEQQLGAFAAAGGLVLFGTDVGYVTTFDPREEYRSMQRAGLSFDQILASLTTNPARRFNVERAGRLAEGYQADLVLTARAPAGDPTALAEVRFAWRNGRQVWGEGR
jgi:imidazolonepropionase-like amidohydrolase